MQILHPKRQEAQIPTPYVWAGENDFQRVKHRNGRGERNIT